MSWRRAGVGNPDRPLLLQLFSPSGGLKEHDGTRYLRLRSPFDYQKAELYLPKMEHEPSAPAFTQELISALPRLLAGKEASLVLFSSYRQMNEWR